MKSTTILFLQGGGKGAYAADQALASYLQHALGETYAVVYPRVPGEEDPVYETYKTTIEQAFKETGNALMLVGHSLGACYLLNYLSENKPGKHIAGIFLAAAPFWGEGGWQFEGFSVNNNLAAAATAGIPLFFYHGTRDETVPFSHLALYREKFPKAAFREIAGKGHQLDNNLSEMVQDINALHERSQ